MGRGMGLPGAGGAASVDNEKDMLRTQAEMLEQQLEQVRRRISEIEREGRGKDA